MSPDLRQGVLGKECTCFFFCKKLYILHVWLCFLKYLDPTYFLDLFFSLLPFLFLLNFLLSSPSQILVNPFLSWRHMRSYCERT